MNKLQELELRSDFERRRRMQEITQRNAARATLPSVGTYVGRSDITGYRTLMPTEGGVAFSRYYGNAKVPTNPELVIRGGLGQPGLLNSRPAN
jgi:hypothetical protein